MSNRASQLNARWLPAIAIAAMALLLLATRGLQYRGPSPAPDNGEYGPRRFTVRGDHAALVADGEAQSRTIVRPDQHGGSRPGTRDLMGRVVTPFPVSFDVAHAILRLDGQAIDRVGVDEGGRFSFRGSGWMVADAVEIESPYLWLEEPQRIFPGNADEIVLKPSIGGAMAVNVTTEDGVPVPGMAIVVSEQEGLLMRGGETDERGQLHLLRLPPGSYEVEYIEGKGLSADPLAIAHDQQMDVLRSHVVALVSPGRTTDVLLGMRPKDGINICGIVITDTGRPVTAGVIRASASEHPEFGLKDAQIETDGSFCIALYRGGLHSFSVDTGEGEFIASGRHHVVDARTDPVTLVLPTAQLSGVVLDPSDRPIRGVVVHLRTDRDSGAVDGIDYTRAQFTDAGGAFGFRSLPAGRYKVTVGGQRPLEGSGYKGGTALCDRVVEVRAGQNLSGVDFYLREGQALSGSVFSSVVPWVGGGSVFARRLGVDDCDWIVGSLVADDGLFALEGLSAGQWAIRAFLGDVGVSKEVTVDIGEQGAESVALIAEPATAVSVWCLDENDAPTRFQLRVTDGNGCAWTVWGRYEAMKYNHTLSPLIVGEYLMQVRTVSGSTCNQQLFVSGMKVGQEVVVRCSGASGMRRQR